MAVENVSSCAPYGTRMHKMRKKRRQMSFPFGNMFGAVVEDVRVPEGTVYLIHPHKPIRRGRND
jgi:hypothetical protein